VGTALFRAVLRLGGPVTRAAPGQIAGFRSSTVILYSSGCWYRWPKGGR